MNSEEIFFYVVCNRSGAYFHRKGYGGVGDSWVNSLDKARIYTKPGQARAQATFWAKHYPEFGTPIILRLRATIDGEEDQEARIASALQKAKEANQRLKIAQAKRDIKEAERKLAELEAADEQGQ